MISASLFSCTSSTSRFTRLIHGLSVYPGAALFPSTGTSACDGRSVQDSEILEAAVLSLLRIPVTVHRCREVEAQLDDAS